MNQNNFWDFFLKHYRVTYIIVILVVIFGVISIWQMPKESSPEIDVPIAMVTTILPGANSRDVETLVTDPIEQKLLNMEDLDTFTSTSREGISVVVVQFDINTDGDEQVSKLRDKLANIANDLPSDAELPIIEKIRFTDQAILVMTMSGDYNSKELRDYAEIIETDVEKIPFVSRVDIVGAPAKEMKVEINKNKLDQYNLSIGQVVGAIRAANSSLPIGSIETGDEVFSLRLSGELKTIEDLRQVPVVSINNTPVVLQDLGLVEEFYSNNGSLSRLSVAGDKSEPAVTLYVYKSTGGDIIGIVDQVQTLVEELIGTSIPSDLDLAYIENWADMIKVDLYNLIFSGLQTVILVFLLLVLFLGWREALLASLVVPLTFFITFICLSYLDYTINFLTLFSLILALGILVDASIVVVESLYQNLGAGQTPEEAAHNTTQEFALPLISGTLTTVLVFLPMMLTSGIIGKFIKSIPVTITIVLFSSLFVSLGILTTLGARFLKSKHNTEYFSHVGIAKKMDTYSKVVKNKYLNILSDVLSDKIKQKNIYIGLVVAFILSISLPIIGLVSVNMFPASNYDTFYIDITNPIGTTLDETNESAKTLESILVQDERIDTFVMKIGGGATTPHTANFIIKINPDSKDQSLNLIDEYDKKLAGLFRGELVVRGLEDGPPQGSPVQINISGESIDDIEKLAGNYQQILGTIPGTQNIRLSSPESNGEFVLSVDRVKAKIYNVDPTIVAGLLRSAITGTTATVIKEGQTDIDVIVKYQIDTNKDSLGLAPSVTLDTIKGLTVATPSGSVPISMFTSVELTNSRSVIEHEDGKRQIKILSDVAEGFTAQGIIAEFNEARNKVSVAEDIVVDFGGEQEDINESFADMGKAMILGMFSIFALLVWQFRSFKQPIYVMTSIPLSLIGVLVGLFVVRQPLSFPGFIGVVALAGIVVNNAIILIDRINSDRDKGLSKIDAIKESAQSRLQPIFLTTITTVLGMLPLAISSETWGPLAYSIVFGLSFSTVLTLFLVPMLYNRFEK
ncbi:MAG: hydrophobic/amphiphilic exporter (mainly bacteria), family [Patescibacteria group bacterium]|nr:hydrophobic/amphiphilic exporter (mainly bacteria), family [Patescibacteria group bacterium]